MYITARKLIDLLDFKASWSTWAIWQKPIFHQVYQVLPAQGCKALAIVKADLPTCLNGKFCLIDGLGSRKKHRICPLLPLSAASTCFLYTRIHPDLTIVDFLSHCMPWRSASLMPWLISSKDPKHLVHARWVKGTTRMPLHVCTKPTGSIYLQSLKCLIPTLWCAEWALHMPQWGKLYNCFVSGELYLSYDPKKGKCVLQENMVKPRIPYPAC